MFNIDLRTVAGVLLNLVCGIELAVNSRIFVDTHNLCIKATYPAGHKCGFHIYFIGIVPLRTHTADYITAIYEHDHIVSPNFVLDSAHISFSLMSYKGEKKMLLLLGNFSVYDAFN